MPKEILEQFQKEFSFVYEWNDSPDVVYPEHKHNDKVALFITSGEVTFLFSETNESKTVKEGERFDVPVGVLHSAKVGKDGCSYIVGEMMDGDS